MFRLLVAVWAMCPSSALAGDVELPWQGRLVDTAGTPIEGSHSVTVTLRDSEDAEIWSKVHTGVPFSRGYVSLVLQGLDVEPSGRDLVSSMFAQDVFLTVAIDGAPPLSPPQSIGAVPRAASVVGAVRVGTNTSTCDAQSDLAGSLRWTGTQLQVCDGTAWTDIASDAASGGSQATAAASCNALHTADPSLPDGAYWIDPNGGSTADAFQAWCEMDEHGGGWTLCLSNVSRGKGTSVEDSNTWWTSNWDNGSRVFSRANKLAGSNWGNFCPMMASSASEVYATIHAQRGERTLGDTCTLNSAWFTPDAGHMALACNGSTRMSALPKSGFDDQGCVGCIYWDNATTPNTGATGWTHNYFGTHVIVKPQGSSAYGPNGIHWGYVNSGMTATGDAGDVHCGENGNWCYEDYWGSHGPWYKSMQLYVR